MAVTWCARRWVSLSPREIDLLLAVGLATVVALAAVASDESGADDSALAACALGLVLGGLVLLRRRWPVAVLVASIVSCSATTPPTFRRSGRAGRWSWRCTPAPPPGGCAPPP